MFCAQQAAEFRRHQNEIEKLGATLSFIGSGSPAHARYFRTEVLGIQGDTGPNEPRIFSDPRREAYEAAGLKRGIFKTLNPTSLRRGMKARSEGFRQRKTMGDPFQQGGVLVVAPNGQVIYSYASNEAGDHPPIADVLGSLRKSA